MKGDSLKSLVALSSKVKAAYAVCLIESFKPPLLKVGVRRSFPAYPHAPKCETRHSNSNNKTPFYSLKVKT